MEDLVYYNELFEIYNELLTDNEKETFKDYYFEDLSLSEIADNKNVSRAAIQKTVKNVIDKLVHYEGLLHICERNKKLKNILEINDVKEIKDCIKDLLEV